MDYDDGGDLLGRRTLPIVHEEGRSWFALTLWTTLFMLVVVPGWIYLLGPKVSEYRERKYRKQIRRKYGIPDDDNDVFNVAYARAVMRRQEEERKAQQAFAGKPAQVVEGNTTGINQGYSNAKENGNVYTIPSMQKRPNGMISSTIGKGSTQKQLQDRFDYSSQPAREEFGEDEHVQSYSKSRARKSMDDMHVMPGSAEPVVSSPLHEEVYAPRGHESSRKSDKDMDGCDGEADVSMDVSIGDSSVDRSFRRGSKRHLVPSEDHHKKLDHKRLRRHSEKRSFLGQENEEEEDRDQLMDLDQHSRGKKRDRAEAGSTFGVDEDSPHAQGRKVRRRKRKSGVEGVELDSRGTKRSLDLESTLDSDGDDRHLSTKMPRKRGKRHQYDESMTDDSMEDLSIQIDPACGDRRVGEEWHANGQLWRVGPRGQRQRQVLVKKRRSRYSMPVDSQHPDSQAQLVVLVEKWLDDDEYKLIEERGEIFSPKDEDMDVVRDEIVDSPNTSGKQLLWQSPKRTNSSSRMLFKDSIVTNLGLNINPFEQPVAAKYGRRVSAGPAVFRVSTADVPLLRHSKSYSKWEKQELEAEAMNKLRKRLEEQKRLAAPDTKHVSFELPTAMSAPSISKSFSNISESKTTPPLSSVPPSAVESVTSNTSTAADSNKPMIATPSISSPFSMQNATSPSTVPQADKDVSAKQPNAIVTEQASGLQAPKVAPPFAATWGTTVPKAVPAPSATAGSTKESAGAPAVTAPANAPASFAFGDKAKTAGASSSPFAFATSAPKPSTGDTITSPFASSMNNSSAPSPFVFKSANQTDKASTPFAPAQDTTSGTTSMFGAKPTMTTESTGSIPPSNSGFAFTKPTFPSTNTQSPFSFAPPAARPEIKTPATKPDTTMAFSDATAPKFNFGFSKPVAAPTPASTGPAASTPSEAPKGVANSAPTTATSTSSPFKFNIPTPQPAATTSSAAPNFSFGFTPPPTGQAPPTAAASPGSSASKPEITVTSPAGTSQPAAPKFSFNFGGSSTPASSESSSPFAAAKTAPSPFASSVTKPSDVPKPLFGMGSSTTPASKTPTSENKQDKPAFSFNFGGPTSASSRPSPFVTQSTTPAGTPGSNAASAASVFDAKPTITPSFGFGAPSAMSTPQQNPFGTTAAPSGTTSSPFGTSNSTSTFGSAFPSSGSGSVFNFPSNTNNSNQKS